MRNSSVKGRYLKCFNGNAGGDGPRLYVLFRVLQNPHLIHTTSRVASVTVALKPVLTADRIHVNNLERGFVEHLVDPAI